MLDQINKNRKEQQTFFTARRKIGQSAAEVATAH